MYFCQDVDLMGWEPGIFGEASFGHQAIIKNAAGTLTGTSLVMAESVLGVVSPGMVASVALADDSASQLVEVVSVADGTHGEVSGLRGRGDEAAVVPAVQGSVKVTVVSFRPQIGAVGDGLLAMMGVASDRDAGPVVATADLRGFRTACVFGVLSAVFRTLVAEGDGGTTAKAKLEFYERLFAAARRAISGKVDEDGDGVAEACVEGGVGRLVRE